MIAAGARRRRKLLTLAGSALVVATVLSGCGQDVAPTTESGGSSSTTPTNVYEEQRSAGVQAALDALGKGLLAGDSARVTDLLDASASPAFRARIETSIANLAGAGPGSRSSSPTSSPALDLTSTPRPESPSADAPSATPSASVPPPDRGEALQLKDLRYVLAPTEEAETLVPADLQARLDAQGSSDSWVAPVELHYALGGATKPGLDEPEVVVSSQFVMARYGDAWKIVGDASAIGAAAMPTQLWELPDVAADDVATAGGESVVASYPGTETVVDRVRRLLPGATAAVTDFWGSDWPRRAAVVATGRPSEFRDLAQSASTDIAGAAAATVFSRIDTGAHSAAGQRIILTPNAGELAEPALAVVLRHELTHVAARVVTSPGAPLWITEGVPEYVGRKDTYVRLEDAAPDLAAAVRAGEGPTALPTDREFAVDSDQALVAYQAAWSVSAFVAARFGEEKLKELYVGVAGTDDVKRQDVAIRRVLGMSRAEFVASWRRWLNQQVD
ncbi:hypothetical protein [Gordonia hankookensis]|uniref:Uncharacterized protein n=1 Tax=Gordonia hankookensis TaxID=589403 RepID=A0ABR7W7C9_9ACTN|nr:hypothetical protein [Gordonia hankookensis]MBD1318133.1 hypothetical protein [Gordonia hankookensis]NDZ95488.1 hypothetical protein [Streptomyces sp. SID11726]NEB25682.1 hypothetical protein [Streptomyces sp. SID6673]